MRRIVRDPPLGHGTLGLFALFLALCFACGLLCNGLPSFLNLFRKVGTDGLQDDF